MATITKLGEHSYRFVLASPMRRIDEEVNDVQLLALLARETLMDRNGEVIPAEYVMARLDALGVGEQLEVIVVARP
jgi:hypothetical protein